MKFHPTLQTQHLFQLQKSESYQTWSEDLLRIFMILRSWEQFVLDYFEDVTPLSSPYTLKVFEVLWWTNISWDKRPDPRYIMCLTKKKSNNCKLLHQVAVGHMVHNPYGCLLSNNWTIIIFLLWLSVKELHIFLNVSQLKENRL